MRKAIGLIVTAVQRVEKLRERALIRMPRAGCALLIVLAAVVGCRSGPQAQREAGEQAGDVATETPRDAPGAPADDDSEAGVQADAGSAEAAALVIAAYYEAIARRDYGRAYRYWAGRGAASGQTFEQFRAGYEETARVRVDIGEPGTIGAAAGSRYVDIPVRILATTTDGRAQGFEGVYTLRRGVVPGAAMDERLWRIYSAGIEPCDPAACEVGRNAGKDAAQEVSRLVERFGERLARVSLQAPRDSVRRQIRAEYGPLVTPALLDVWLADLASAPGRAVSSPWPQRIEVLRTRRIDPRSYEVAGEIVYVTSVELTRGGAAAREGVVLRIERNTEGRWRIAGYAPSG